MAPIFESNFSIRNILGTDNTNIQENMEIENNAPPTPPCSDGSVSPRSNGSLDREMIAERPNFTYSALVAMAIRSSPEQRLPLSAIQEWISENFPYYRKDQHGWQSQVRHTLSTNTCFVKVPRPLYYPGRGNYWIINPAIEEISVSAATGRLEIDTSSSVRSQLPGNGHGYPLNQVISHGVPVHHPQASNAVYFPPPEEHGRAQQVMMMKSLQEQQALFHYHQHQQQLIQQQLTQIQQQQQLQQQYAQLQQQLLFHQQQCEFMM